MWKTRRFQRRATYTITADIIYACLLSRDAMRRWPNEHMLQNWYYIDISFEVTTGCRRHYRDECVLNYHISRLPLYFIQITLYMCVRAPTKKLLDRIMIDWKWIITISFMELEHSGVRGRNFSFHISFHILPPSYRQMRWMIAEISLLHFIASIYTCLSSPPPPPPVGHRHIVIFVRAAFDDATHKCQLIISPLVYILAPGQKIRCLLF